MDDLVLLKNVDKKYGGKAYGLNKLMITIFWLKI